MEVKESPGFKLDYTCSKPYMEISYRNFNKKILLPHGLTDEQYQDLFLTLAETYKVLTDLAYQEGEYQTGKKVKIAIANLHL